MKTNNNEIILQENIPLSKCLLWSLQKEFFHSHGIDAWNNKVPFYITSNLFLANSYAKIIIGFIRDCIEKYKNPSEPLYILELGTGSGQFSFYLLKKLVALEESYGLKNSFIYIMSDFTENNLKFWKTHPKLTSYVERGCLDFAIYDAEKDMEIELIVSGKKFKKNSLSMPLVVIANYFFDSIPHDVFRIQDNKLKEGLVTLTTTNTNKENTKIHEIKESYVYKDIELPYYQEKELNMILGYYKENLSNSSFLIPISGLRCIKNLAEFSSDDLFLLSTDRGHTTLFELEQPNDPIIAHHASFSLEVNFHSIGEYCKRLNGDFLHQSIRPGIKTSVFFVGDKLENFKETKKELAENIENFSLSNFYDIHFHVNKSKFDCELRVILAVLQLSDWDPHIFNVYFSTITNQIHTTTETVKKGFISAVPKIAENFYFMPEGVNIINYIGDFFRIIQDYKKALIYYNDSMDSHGRKYETLLNMGICYYYEDDFDAAKKIFKEALAINPASCVVESWIAKVDKDERETTQ